MSETLKGNLSQLKLVDILKILCNSQRTGKLSLQSGEETADIYFLTGSIIHAKYGSTVGEEAIYETIGWSEGVFAFHPNISVKNKTIGTTPDQIIRKGDEIDADWEAIRVIVPNNNLVFKMSSGTPSEISLNAIEWNILRHINGIDSIREIAHKVDILLLDVAKAFRKLYEAGLIEIVGESVGMLEQKVGIDPAIFDLVEKELARIIGPLAAIVLDDSIQSLGESRDAFPKDKLPDLVENLSNEISDPRKLIDFQKNMLEIIKNT